MSLDPDIAAVLAGESEGCIVTGDCLDVMADMPDGCVDAVVTDPPYGIGYEASRYQHARFAGVMAGDLYEFDPAWILRLGSPCCFWGANNYAMRLPRGGWLVWDKRVVPAADKVLGSPFELAWVTNTARYAIARIQHGGVINADGPGRVRVHPTQKPVILMEWSIKQACPKARLILDPFCGSGTTCVAAKKLGRRWIGIEIDPKYADIARNRVASTPRPLFAAERPKAAESPKLFPE